MLSFITRFYAWTTICVMTLFLLLIYAIVTEKIVAEDTVVRYKRAEAKLNRRAFVGSFIWTIMVIMLSFSEATLPLKEYFTEIGHENPLQASLACSACYVLAFVCGCDLITMATVELRLRWVRTTVLNRGKR